MIEVVSIKFKNRGKSYFFAPNGLQLKSGEKVIVETSKGMEIADCVRGNHNVMDDSVVQPLRPVLRVATKDDLRIAQLNVEREKEAFDICQQKIAEHGLDMKLVDVECNFEGTKTMFFFTSDGRVDFRELVKDLASIFRNRIELRQIGVRDEAKMIGGIGICGRPYCCSQFLDDFQPVSTKMAKIQSLSLNPAKISGSCGRLMCCLRYEQEAYESLVKNVPKQGAYVETKDGFGTAVQINLLRQTIKVKLDSDSDNELRTYKTNEFCTVPGGRPRDGETPVSTFKYVPEVEEEDEPELKWEPIYSSFEEEVPAAAAEAEHKSNRRRRQRKPRQQHKEHGEQHSEAKPRTEAHKEKGEAQKSAKPQKKNQARAKTVKVEAKVQNAEGAKQAHKHRPAKDKPAAKNTGPAENSTPKEKGEGSARRNKRWNHYRGKGKGKGAAQNKAPQQ